MEKPGELSIAQTAKKFNVSRHIVCRWIEQGIVSFRSVGSIIWILLDPNKEMELTNLAQQQTKIVNISTLQAHTPGGAL